MTDQPINLAQIKGEATRLRHAFRQESHPRRSDMIVHVHDVENCKICALVEAVEAAHELAAAMVDYADPLPNEAEPLRALVDALARFDFTGGEGHPA